MYCGERRPGQRLRGNDKLAQSIGDILSTPIGTRAMRRDYGPMLTDLNDQPANSITRQLLFAATAVALSRWEPRLKLTRVGVSHDTRETGRASCRRGACQSDANAGVAVT